MSTTTFRRPLLARLTDEDVDFIIYICTHMGPMSRIADLHVQKKGEFRDLLVGEYIRYRKVQPTRMQDFAGD